MLIIIEVTIGKWKETFPFLKLMSPGNFPMIPHNNPITIKTTPITINILPISVKFAAPPD